MTVEVIYGQALCEAEDTKAAPEESVTNKVSAGKAT